MRANRPDRKQIISASCHQHWLAEGVPQKHLAIGQLVDVTTFFEIRSFKFLSIFRHKDSFVASQYNRFAATCRVH